MIHPRSWVEAIPDACGRRYPTALAPAHTTTATRAGEKRRVRATVGAGRCSAGASGVICAVTANSGGWAGSGPPSYGTVTLGCGRREDADRVRGHGLGTFSTMLAVPGCWGVRFDPPWPAASRGSARVSPITEGGR